MDYVYKLRVKGTDQFLGRGGRHNGHAVFSGTGPARLSANAQGYSRNEENDDVIELVKYELKEVDVLPLSTG